MKEKKKKGRTRVVMSACLDRINLSNETLNIYLYRIYMIHL